MLLGQNVNAYDGPSSDDTRWSLAKLCEAIAGTPGIARIRYTTSHPRDMADDLIAAHRDNPKLMPYLHLPVQSGSDAVLDAMNRQHSSDDYRRLVERIRAARPDIALSSDFIVGFPGESDADFEATLKLVRDIGYATAFSFKYSKRPGTPASTMRKQIPEDVKAARLAQSADAVARTSNMDSTTRRSAGRCRCCSKRRRATAGQIMGRTPYLQPVHVKADAGLIGQVRGCRRRPAHRQQPAWSARLNARRRETDHAGISRQQASAPPWAARTPSTSPGWNRSSTVGIDMRGNLVAIDGKERERAGAHPARALYPAGSGRKHHPGRSGCRDSLHRWRPRQCAGCDQDRPARARCARARPRKAPIWS